MTVAAEKTYTAEDLLNDPALDRFELVRGQLRERPVSVRSGEVAARVVFLLSIEANRTRSAKVFTSDTGYRCYADKNTVRLPDISVVRTDRLRAMKERDPAFFPIPADLVVEVLSPNDRGFEINDKVDEYLEAGFGLVWVVDPHRRTVQVHQPDTAVRLLNESDEITADSALPGFRCKVSEFFAD